MGRCYMEKDKLFANVSISPHPPNWQSSTSGMSIQPGNLNCISQALESGFLNLNWEDPLDQSAPFESVLNSVSSAAPATTAFSSNALCYSAPLNAPPKLNPSTFPENTIMAHPSLAPFSTDPGFVERAAKFSCFNNGGQLGFPETEFTQRSMFWRGSGKLSRVSSSQSLKIGKEMVLPDGFEVEGRSVSAVASASDRKFSGLSRSSTPDTEEFGNGREESSPSVIDMGLNGQSEIRARKRKAIPKGKEFEKCDSKSKKSKTTEANTGCVKQDAEQSGNQKAADGNQKQTKENPKPPEAPKNYIHVRARRGQATDSHSLAERVRREKISERMKFLQDLVPGCSKVTGKAVMLDEIINYVQSLQRQVEFLSMKLANVNPRLDFKMENLLSKDMLQTHGSLPNPMHHPLDASAPAFPHAQQPRDPMHGSANLFDMHRNLDSQLPSIIGCGDASSQLSNFLEDDLQCCPDVLWG